jgi:hypothetical protein
MWLHGARFVCPRTSGCVCVLARPGRFKGEVVHWYEESDTYDVLYSGLELFFFLVLISMNNQTKATC